MRQDKTRCWRAVLACRFGTFLPRERAARKGRNPQSGEPMELPASKTPAFTASKVTKFSCCCCANACSSAFPYAL